MPIRGQAQSGKTRGCNDGGEGDHRKRSDRRSHPDASPGRSAANHVGGAAWRKNCFLCFALLSCWVLDAGCWMQDAEAASRRARVGKGGAGCMAGDYSRSVYMVRKKWLLCGRQTGAETAACARPMCVALMGPGVSRLFTMRACG